MPKVLHHVHLQQRHIWQCLQKESRLLQLLRHGTQPHLRSADSSSKGTAIVNRYLLTMLYSVAFGDIRPKLLRTRPASVLTRGLCVTVVNRARPLLIICQAQVVVTSPCLPAQLFTPFGLFRPAGSIRLMDLAIQRKCSEYARYMSPYQRPAAPAQVRQAHTRHGLLAATDRAAQTWTGRVRAVLRRVLATLRKKL